MMKAKEFKFIYLMLIIFILPPLTIYFYLQGSIIFSAITAVLFYNYLSPIIYVWVFAIQDGQTMFMRIADTYVKYKKNKESFEIKYDINFKKTGE